MSTESVGSRGESAERLRAELVYTFGDYHSPIPLQVALVDALIAAVAREERERCAKAADRSGLDKVAADVTRAAAAIARAFRPAPQ